MIFKHVFPELETLKALNTKLLIKKRAVHGVGKRANE